MKKLIVFLIFIFFFFFSSSLVLASEEFETSYQVRYQINPNGLTQVTQNISLTNKLSNVYATQYSLFFQTSQIENIKARDDLGPLEIDLKQTSDSTEINLKFNQEVVGTGKTLDFTVSYDAPDLVDKTGQVWEVSVPKLANAAEMNDYQLQLAVPTSFGATAYISPQPISISLEENFQVFSFTKNQLVQSSVSAAFGQFQVFDFIFDYHLKNDRLTPVTTEIALPPDTAYQKVYYESLEPKPTNVRVDEDGNWLANYTLSGNQKLNIQATGQVKVFSQPQKNFPTTSQETLQKNLQEQEYWPVNYLEIKEITSQLKSIEDVYDFVVDYLGYDFDQVKEGTERKGALAALEEPDQSICMEFTDLFVSLARTLGIPAREINGYAYTTNPKLRPLSLVADVLHSWPEYWDDEKKIWVPVDPTWEKTTGGVDFFHKADLNHFAFVIHGVDSQLPAPAGSYRTQEDGGKNIQISFGKFKELPDSKIEVEFALPKSIFAGLKTKGNIIIHNLGPTAIYHLPTNVSGEGITINFASSDESALIPPFAKQEIPIEVYSKNWFEVGSAKINLSLDSQKYNQTIKIKSFIWQGVLPVIGGLILLTAISLAIFKLTSRKLRGTKKLE